MQLTSSFCYRWRIEFAGAIIKIVQECCPHNFTPYSNLASTNWSDFVLLYSHKMASLATRNSSFFWHFLNARPLAFYDVNYTMRLAWPAKREWYGNSKQILWNFQDASVGSSQNKTLKRPQISPFRILSFWKILSLVDFPVDWKAFGRHLEWMAEMVPWMPCEMDYLYPNFWAPWISSPCDLSGG